MLDLTDSSIWQLTYSQLFVAANQTTDGNYEPIQDFEVYCDAATIAVGASNSQAYYNWQLGAWCYNNIPTSPSNNFQDLQLGRFAVPLGRLAVYQINNLTPPPYTLLFKVPKWHRELYIEVWSLIE